MHLDALAPSTKAAFGKIAKLPLVNKFYLAGGSAVAIYLGHRYSHDLDFFTDRPFDQVRLSHELSKAGKLATDTLDADTLLGSLDGVKASFFLYRYPLLYPSKRMDNVKVADQRDLVAMKLQAISDRGKKRDFVDLYFLLNDNNWSLAQAIGWFNKRYKKINLNMVHLLKSLVYFSDAESDKDLEMIRPVDWEKVKRFFKNEVKAIEL